MPRPTSANIHRVGALDDGTPVYRFRSRGSPVTQIGLMADDVEKTVPEAVATWRGFKVLDYDLATRRVRSDDSASVSATPKEPDDLLRRSEFLLGAMKRHAR